MKRLIFPLFWVALLLAACTPAQEPLPTLLPVAQATGGQTSAVTVPPTHMPPTLTEYARQLTGTSTLSPPRTPSATPSPPVGPSPTPVPTRTHTPWPTRIPEDTATPPPPTPPPPAGPPFTEGMIAVLWNPAFEEDKRVVTYQLDFALPGETPDKWVIQTALTGLTSPYMFPAPDGQKLALAQYQDTNGDGYVPSPRGGDAYDVFLYTISDGSLVRITNNQKEHFPEVSWLPDSQSFTFPISNDIWVGNLSNLSSSKLLENLDFRVYAQIRSPDGRFLAVHTKGVEEPSPPGFAHLSIYDSVNKNLVRVLENTDDVLDLRWSSDSQWLAVAPRHDGGLFLINPRTFENLVIVSAGSRKIVNEWSPDGKWLAYVEDVSTVKLWHSVTKEHSDLIQGPHVFSQFAWSPDSSELAFTIWEEEQTNLVIIDRESGDLRILHVVNAVDKNERPYGFESISEMQLLTWSSDSQWILFFAEQENGAGFYIINREGSLAHLILETGIHSFFQQWLARSETDRTRRVVWLTDTMK